MLNSKEFSEYFDVRSWLASSGNIDNVHSAIVNIKNPIDRRYNVKMYIWWDFDNNKYQEERA